MKTLALLLAFLTADETLVEVARQSKAKRSKSTTKVITNADVKKAKAKLQTTNGPTTPVVREPTLMEKHVARRTAEAAAAERKARQEKLVAELEKELAAIEQSYYSENDLSKRDSVIVARFNDVKAKLDEARKALDGAAAAEAPQPKRQAP